MGSKTRKETIMKKLIAKFCAIALLAVLTACGQKTEAPPANPTVVIQSMPAPDPVKAQEENAAKMEQVQKEQTIKDEETKKAAKKYFGDNVDAALERLNGTKKMALKDQQDLAALVPREYEYLGSISSYVFTTMVAPGRDFSGEYEVARAEQARLISEVLLWAKKDMVATEKLIDPAIPALKMKAGLVIGLRDNVGLLTKQYTDKGFVQILACVDYELHPSQKESCRKVFASFGVKFKANDEADRLDDVDRNAVYIVKFLNRRSLNGGEKFAQFAQRMMLKLAK